MEGNNVRLWTPLVKVYCHVYLVHKQVLIWNSKDVQQEISTSKEN